MLPDERAFRASVERPDFHLGEVEQRWKLVSISWPHAIIAVIAADGREIALRFHLAGYPTTLPTAQPWDAERGEPLAHALWPKSKGGRLGSVFNHGWKKGAALYLPCDREAIEGHDVWRKRMPSKIWRPADGIIQYLEQVHELLNSRDYARATAA